MTESKNTSYYASTLYIVPTPIGNLGDITYRAIDILSNVNIIAAEDTRHTGKLLSHFDIQTRMFSLHDHNEREKSQVLIDKLLKGESIALVSDAGTPLISDPGYHLVKGCRQAGIAVIPLPGACAVITALSASGLPSDSFSFEGFLPPKSKARKEKLQTIAHTTRTCIFYESPHRIIDSLADVEQVLGSSREVVLARELTKRFESIQSMPVGELLTWIQEDDNRKKGEMVLLIRGCKKNIDDSLSIEIIKSLTVLTREMPLKKASALISEIYDVKKNTLYKWGLENLS